MIISPGIGFTTPKTGTRRDFLKASHIIDYVQLKKISCEANKQARACVIHEIFGLKTYGTAIRVMSVSIR